MGLIFNLFIKLWLIATKFMYINKRGRQVFDMYPSIPMLAFGLLVSWYDDDDDFFLTLA